MNEVMAWTGSLIDSELEAERVERCGIGARRRSEFIKGPVSTGECLTNRRGVRGRRVSSSVELSEGRAEWVGDVG